MARNDLVLALVRAGVAGDREASRRAAEAIVVDERAKQRSALADRLETALKTTPKATMPAGDDLPGFKFGRRSGPWLPLFCPISPGERAGGISAEYVDGVHHEQNKRSKRKRQPSAVAFRISFDSQAANRMKIATTSIGRASTARLRVSWSPSERWALQASWVDLASPEQLEPEIDETRWSVSVTVLLGESRFWPSTLTLGEKEQATKEVRLSPSRYPTIPIVAALS